MTAIDFETMLRNADVEIGRARERVTTMEKARDALRTFLNVFAPPAQAAPPRRKAPASKRRKAALAPPTPVSDAPAPAPKPAKPELPKLRDHILQIASEHPQQPIDLLRNIVADKRGVLKKPAAKYDIRRMILKLIEEKKLHRANDGGITTQYTP